MFGTGEIIVILCVILILFGGKKLPGFARSLGEGIKEFKRACQGLQEENSLEKEIEKSKEIQPETIIIEPKQDRNNE